MDEVAAAMWLFDSRSNLEISGDVERKVEADGDGMNDRGYFEATIERSQKLKSSKHFNQSRDCVFRRNTQMHRVDADTIVLLTIPVLTAKVDAREESTFERLMDAAFQAGEGTIKGKEKVVVRLRRTKKGWTKLDLAVELDFGGGVSHDASLAAVKCRLDEVGRLSVYFQRLVPLECLTEEDGVALADDLLFCANSSRQRLERLPEVMAKNAALAELKTNYEGFEPLLRRFLSGSLGLSRAVSTKLVCVNEKEGKQLGKNGVMAVKSKKKAEAGVDQWKRQVS